MTSITNGKLKTVDFPTYLTWTKVTLLLEVSLKTGSTNKYQPTVLMVSELIQLQKYQKIFGKSTQHQQEYFLLEKSLMVILAMFQAIKDTLLMLLLTTPYISLLKMFSTIIKVCSKLETP